MDACFQCKLCEVQCPYTPREGHEFRFDFPNAGAVPKTVLADVEQRVNEILVDDLSVDAELMPIDEARASGAMALSSRVPSSVKSPIQKTGSAPT